jgi:hypothetical protein
MKKWASDVIELEYLPILRGRVDGNSAIIKFCTICVGGVVTVRFVKSHHFFESFSLLRHYVMTS